MNCGVPTQDRDGAVAIAGIAVGTGVVTGVGNVIFNFVRFVIPEYAALRLPRTLIEPTIMLMIPTAVRIPGRFGAGEAYSML